MLMVAVSMNSGAVQWIDAGRTRGAQHVGSSSEIGTSQSKFKLRLNLAILNVSVAMKTCVRNQELDHNPTSLLDTTSSRPCKGCHHSWHSWHSDHASWCDNALEFDLQHACIRPSLSHCYRRDFRGQGNEEIWAWWGRVGSCAAAMWYVGGLSFPYLSESFISHLFTVIQRCDPVLFSVNVQSFDCDSSNGSYQCTSRHGKSKPAVFASHSCFAGTWKMTPQQILWYDWSLRGLPNCHEWVLCSVFLSSITYNLSTVLHPQHKLQYFQDANWDDEWIDTATGIVCEEFLQAYTALIDEVELVRPTMVKLFPFDIFYSN